MAVRLELVLLLANAHHAGPHDLLFVGAILLRPLRIEEVAVRLADGLRWIRQAEVLRQRLADANEPAVLILEVDEIRGVLHERGQQESLEGQFLFHATPLRDLAPQLFVGRRQARPSVPAHAAPTAPGIRATPAPPVSARVMSRTTAWRMLPFLQVDAGQQHIGGEVRPVGAAMHPFEPGHAIAIGLRDPRIGRGPRIRAVRLIRRRHFAGMPGEKLLLRATAKQLQRRLIAFHETRSLQQHDRVARRLEQLAIADLRILHGGAGTGPAACVDRSVLRSDDDGSAASGRCDSEDSLPVMRISPCPNVVFLFSAMILPRLHPAVDMRRICRFGIRGSEVTPCMTHASLNAACFMLFPSSTK